MSRLYVQTRWAEVEPLFSTSGRATGLAERIDDCANHGGGWRPKRDRKRVKRLAKERMKLREANREHTITAVLRQPYDFDPRDPINKSMEKWGNHRDRIVYINIFLFNYIHSRSSSRGERHRASY